MLGHVCSRKISDNHDILISPRVRNVSALLQTHRAVPPQRPRSRCPAALTGDTEILHTRPEYGCSIVLDSNDDYFHFTTKQDGKCRYPSPAPDHTAIFRAGDWPRPLQYGGLWPTIPAFGEFEGGGLTSDHRLVRSELPNPIVWSHLAAMCSVGEHRIPISSKPETHLENL